MSYETGTAHYNLPQTVGTDKRDWADTNTAFANIDAAIYQASEDASTAASAASTAQTTASAAQTAASNAQTAASSASTAAASAGELAQTAKTRADNAYTAAESAEASRGILKVLSTQSGSSTKTWSTLLGNLFSSATSAYNANKNIGLRVATAFGGENRVFIAPLVVKDNNFAFEATHLFTGACVVQNFSVRSSGSVYSTLIIGTGLTDHSAESTSGTTVDLVCFG